jgi:leader peptidase (prepilin peptidase)/N-methyltransferase
LGFVRTAPVLSFVWQRGACFACGGQIDRLHLTGEMAGAIILASAFAAAPLGRAVLLSILGLALLVAVLCDVKVRRLPDPMTAVIGMAAAALAVLRSTDALVVGAACGLVTFVVLEGLRRGFLHYRGRSGLGGGDIKLLTALAVWVGPHTPWLVAAASALGLMAALVRPPPDGRQAFGPYIAVAGWIIGIAGEGGLWPMAA